MTINLHDDRAEWDIFCSRENFQLAWRRVRNSVRFEVKDRLGLDVYGTFQDVLLDDLIEQVKSASGYQPQPAPKYHMARRDRTLRPFPYLSMGDRLIFQALGNLVIKNAYDDFLQVADDTVFAHLPESVDRNGDFTDYVTRRPFTNHRNSLMGQLQRFKERILRNVAEFSQLPDSWFVETDISSFYPSVDQYLLRQTLQRRGWLTDERLLNLLSGCLNAWAIVSVPHQYGRGLPIGYETSDILATLFLMDILAPVANQVTIYRYVDDMVVFARGKNAARQALISLDLQLQAANLIRNGSKTEIIPCDGQFLESKRAEKLLDKRLSLIEVYRAGDEEEPELAQAELGQMLQELSETFPAPEFPCTVDGIDRLSKNERNAAFILYRFRDRNDLLKQLALCMLHEFPERSIQACEYLSLFSGDQEVISALYDAAETSLYPDVRINSAKALSKLVGAAPVLVELLRRWSAQYADWYFCLEALELLWVIAPDKNHFRHVAVNADHELITSKALNFAFELSSDTDELIEYLNHAFLSDRWRLVLIGLQLWRTKANAIHRSQLDLTRFPNVLRQFILTIDDQNAVSTLIDHVERLFGFSISDRLHFFLVFSDLSESAQQLVAAHDATDNHKRYVLMIYPFVEALARAVVAIDHEVSPSAALGSIMWQFYGTEEATLNRLISNHSTAREPSGIIDWRQRELLERELKYLLATFFIKLHLRDGVELTDSLQELQTQQGGASVAEEKKLIFVCYSHKDAEWKDYVLEALGTFQYEEASFLVWSDEEIKASQDWQTEIATALHSASIALLFVSNPFLNSGFIRKQELPVILEREQKSGLKIGWIAVSHNTLVGVDELKRILDIQSLSTNPRDRPLEYIYYRDRGTFQKEVSDIALRIKSMVESTNT